MTSIGLPEIVAAIAVLALNAYALTGGADYGGGIWDLFAAGPRKNAQREQIAHSIGPIWEANHVWLIVTVVLLFTAFPSAFAAIGTVLHIPIALALVGIVLRGSAFVFRRYGPPTGASGWSRTFAVASLLTPLFLGVIIGAVSSGAVGSSAQQADSGSFATVFVAPWLNPFAMMVGLLAVVEFSFLAAVYLARDASDPALREDFRRRALGSAGALFLVAFATLGLSTRGAPRLASGMIGGAWSAAIHVVTGLAAVGAIAALWRRQFRLARLAAAAQVSLILWGWAGSQFPYVIPDTLTIRGAAAPSETLVLLGLGIIGGCAILIPSLRYLFRVFSSVEGSKVR